MKSVYTGGEKVTEFESYDELRVGSNRPAFIYEGDELVYPNPVKEGLVLWYDFSGRTNADGQRDVAEDLSGNGNDGTLQNFNFTAESGYDKNELSFDGVDDTVSASNNESLNITGNFTLESVFNADEVNPSIGGLIVKNNSGAWGSNSYGIRSRFAGGDSPQYYFFIYESPDDHTNRMELNFTLGSTLHIICIANLEEGIMQAYINGVLVSEKTTNVERIQITDSDLYVGQAYSSSFFAGKIFSTKIYNRPLTPEEIAHNYQIEKEHFGIE